MDLEDRQAGAATPEGELRKRPRSSCRALPAPKSICPSSPRAWKAAAPPRSTWWKPLPAPNLKKMVDDLIQRTLAPCKKALADAGISKDQVDEVILVGGNDPHAARARGGGTVLRHQSRTPA